MKQRGDTVCLPGKRRRYTIRRVRYNSRGYQVYIQIGHKEMPAWYDLADLEH